MRRTLKHTYNLFLHLFAVIGLILVGGFFAIRLHLTDVKGAIDPQSTDFSNLVIGIETQKAAANSPSQIENSSSVDQMKILRKKNICQIDAIGYYAPVNAKNILATYEKTQSDVVVSKMIFAAALRLKEKGLAKEFDACENTFTASGSDYAALSAKYADATGQNIFPWMNDEQWQTIKAAISKDKDKINQAAQVAEIEPRLIVSSVIVEQLRLFHSQRELFKKFFEPLKILGNANKISLGVMGIKEATAIETENHLKDPTSVYYLGPKLEHVLDFTTGDPASERYKRLTTEGDYYYSYLYGGIYLKQMLMQWRTAGYDIQYRPEIVGTLFNVGFPQSHPNADPKVGGSEINVGDAKYSFGSLAYEFYYSGEMLEEFPYHIN